jgi:penicillin-binding protein 1C
LRRWAKAAAAAGAGIAGLLALALGLDARYPPALGRFEDLSTVVLDRQGRLLRAFTAADGTWRLAATAADVSPLYLDTLIAYEDRRFAWHPGVDPLAVVRALGQWAANGRVVSGASTITMQVARLLEPRERTLGAKLIEIARAVQLEWRYSKEEILAIYLTLAPFGGNIEGVRAASWAWLGKDPAHLSPGEAALLVALPQSPSRLRPDRDPAAARAARDKVLGRMVTLGRLAAGAAAEAAQQRVPDRRRPMPFLAPHLTASLAAAAPPGAVVPTLIDAPLQAGVEDVARRALPGLQASANLAVLVVENGTRAVAAYLGSADWSASSRAGQVDLARAVRSPGSALKPFIYGMAFEDLIVHPETLVSDRPQRFGDYQPVNFDPVFSGDVTVREALIRSLNVPAVAVLDRVGPPRLAARLRGAGGPLSLPDPAEVPALAIALGGAGITLFDLATLYAALAHQGEAAPLRILKDDPEGPPRRLLEPAAAWQVTSILAEIPPPSSLLAPVYAGPGGRTVAYKTGTSYGFRDAWAVGYDADHTVAVWVGRPDGTPSPDRYGRNTAAPLLFEVFGLLPHPVRDLPGPPPAGVLLAATAELPARLQRLRPRAAMVLQAEGAGGGDDVRIDFPIDGTLVELDVAAEPARTLPLVAVGGRRPLRWLVNGLPVAASPLAREAAWLPDGPGFARITVIDAEGGTDTAEVWVGTCGGAVAAPFAC